MLAWSHADGRFTGVPGSQKSNEQKTGCLGDFSGMKSYPGI